MQHHAFWHVYLSDNDAWWFNIVMDQLNAVVGSGLHNFLDSLNVTVVFSGASSSSVDDFKDLVLSHMPPRCVVTFDGLSSGFESDQKMRHNTDRLMVSEKHTHAKMYDHAWNNDARLDIKYLYFHTKAITRPPGVYDTTTTKNYYYWRKYLNYGVLEQWRKCVCLLKEYGSVGPGLYHTPETHYSGGHWWANASFIRDLPDPSSDWSKDLRNKTKDDWLRSAPDRFYDEMWIGSNRSKNSHFGINHIAQCLNPPVHTWLGESYRPQ